MTWCRTPTPTPTLFLSHHFKCDRMQILPLPPHALPTRAQIESTYSTPKQKSSCQSSHNLTISPRFLEGACFEPQINGATYTFSLRIKGNQSQKPVYILCTVPSCILLVCVRTRQHAFYVQFYWSCISFIRFYLSMTSFFYKNLKIKINRVMIID